MNYISIKDNQITLERFSDLELDQTKYINLEGITTKIIDKPVLKTQTAQ